MISRESRRTRCALCGKTMVIAFHVQGRDTSAHWRCLGCMRRFREPFVVTGWSTGSACRVTSHEEIVQSGRGLRIGAQVREMQSNGDLKELGT